MEVVNNNTSMVMTGMRVQVGTQAIERAPSYVEVFGRTMQINLTRARWFDFPFTREEALQADKKLSIFSKILDVGDSLKIVHLFAALYLELFPVSSFLILIFFVVVVVS